MAVIGILLLLFYYLRNRNRRQLALQRNRGARGDQSQGGHDGYIPAGNGPPTAYWSIQDGTTRSALPALAEEQQSLVSGHLLQQQQWQRHTKEDADRGIAMGTNVMKQKAPIEMSDSPTSYEVSATSLYLELSGSTPPRPSVELPS